MSTNSALKFINLSSFALLYALLCSAQGGAKADELTLSSDSAINETANYTSITNHQFTLTIGLEGEQGIAVKTQSYVGGESSSVEIIPGATFKIVGEDNLNVQIESIHLQGSTSQFKMYSGKVKGVDSKSGGTFFVGDYNLEDTGTVTLIGNNYLDNVIVNSGALNVVGSMGENATLSVNGGKVIFSVSNTLKQITGSNGDIEIKSGKFLTLKVPGKGLKSNESLFQATISGQGGLTIDGPSTSIVLSPLSGNNTYTGATTIKGGTLKLGVDQAISHNSKITVEGGVLNLGGNEHSNIVFLKGGAGGTGSFDDIFSEMPRIENGSLDGVKTLSSKGGVINNVQEIGNLLIDEAGKTKLKGGSTGGSINLQSGELWVERGRPSGGLQSVSPEFNYMGIPTSTQQKDLQFNGSNGFSTTVNDGLYLVIDGSGKPSLKVGDFDYCRVGTSGVLGDKCGRVFLYANSDSVRKRDGDFAYKVLDFDNDLGDGGYQKLFENTYFLYEDGEGIVRYVKFNADGRPSDNDVFVRQVELKKGSLVVNVSEIDLDLPIEPDKDTDGDGIKDDKDDDDDNDGIKDEIDDDDDNDGIKDEDEVDAGDEDESIEDEIEDEIIDEIIDGDDFDPDANQEGDATGDGGGSLDFDDDALEEIGDDFEVWTKEELVGVVTNGLLPRNIDGPGQTLATYNNLLADTVFERTPIRQFMEVDAVVEEVVVPEEEVVPEAEPVRGLWSKSGELNEQQAGEYLEQTVAESAGAGDVDLDVSKPLVLADGQGAVELKGDELLVEIDGKTYLEDGSLTAEYAGRDGVRGWFRGFGGQSSDSNGESDTIFNPYTISAGGGILGVDVSVSESFQLGAYANYGNINLSQRNGVNDMGGGWNADGWGGGITADYWSQNFYVQGLLGATGFSGEQRRNISGYGSFFDKETAKGDKNATTMVGALRIGAPFQTGSTYIEPQLTATWSGNNENSFSESADDDRLGLNYKSRNTNYLQTALGVKFAWPMKTGDTGLFTPSLKLAWLGDWNQGNEGQTIGFDFSDSTYKVGSNQEDVNGALIEAGLDYSVLKLEGTTVKGYLRGGAEVWGGERGTNWRASGGVTFQF